MPVKQSCPLCHGRMFVGREVLGRDPVTGKPRLGKQKWCPKCVNISTTQAGVAMKMAELRGKVEDPEPDNQVEGERGGEDD